LTTTEQKFKKIDWDYSIGNPYTDEIKVFSLFKKFDSTSKTKDISVDEYLDLIRDESKKDFFLKLRELPKDERTKLKANLSVITGSCIVSKGHAKDQINALNGLAVVDFDELPDTFNTWAHFKEVLAADEYSYILHNSASGKLCMFVKVPTENDFEEIYLSFDKYFFKKYGAIIDRTINVNRLRFISYDPDVAINQNSKIYTDLEKVVLSEVKPYVKKDTGANGQTIAEAFNSSGAQGLNLINNELQSRGWIISNGYGKSVFHYKYAPDASPKSMVAFDNGSAVLFCVYSTNTGLKKLPSAGKTYPSYNLYDLYSELNSYSDFEASEKLASLGFGKWNEKKETTPAVQNNTNSKPKKVSIFDNVEIMPDEIDEDDLSLDDKVANWIKQEIGLEYNEVKKRIYFIQDHEELTTAKYDNLFLRARKNKWKINDSIFSKIIYGHNTQVIPHVNPFKKFINENLNIDTNNELEVLCQTINSNTFYKDEWITKWYKCLFAAIEGKTIRFTLTFLGGQYSGKTEWFRRLLPPELYSYFAQTRFERGKDDELLMCENLIVLHDEMGGKSKVDEKLFKELSSADYFNLRPPYEKYNRNFKRLAVLGGTSNDLQVLNDATGNTRILGIEVLSIDHDLYNSIDKTKLFIDGYKKYLADKDCFELTAKERQVLENAESDFKNTSVEEDLIKRFLTRPDEKNHFAEYMTATEIKEYLEESSSKTFDKDGNVRYKSGSKILNTNRLGIYLKKYLGEPQKIYDKKSGNSVRVYYLERVENYRHHYKKEL
jgi:hypothetical protein